MYLNANKSVLKDSIYKIAYNVFFKIMGLPDISRNEAKEQFMKELTDSINYYGFE